MKLGLFGGSFDPVHMGHVVTAREARSSLGLDRVLFLPTSDPPHKGPRVADALARFAMVELALLAEEGLFTSTHELTPGRKAYTVDTLEHFRARYPEAELYLLLGSDSLAGLHRWRRWRDLVSLARIVVLARPGWDVGMVLAGLEPELAGRLAGSASPEVVERSVEAASSEIRDRLGQGEPPPPGSLPSLVLDYVRKYDLYR